MNQARCANLKYQSVKTRLGLRVSADVDTPMTTDILGKALNILSTADERGIEIRLIGALSIKLHCDPKSELFDRAISDIDFVGYAKHRVRIENLLKNCGFQPSEMFNYVNPNRLLFFDQGGMRVDVFLEVFEMCHKFDFRERIALDRPTLPPADLLATKFQIVELNEKDMKDIVSLLRDHELSKSDAIKDTINEEYLAKLCANDWGIYRTFTGTIKQASQFLTTLALDDKDKESVLRKLNQLLVSIEAMPKSLKWKMRARIGEKRVWYNLPETRIIPDSPRTD
jgi:hypothetical protein